MALERGQDYLQGTVEKAFIFIGPPTSGKTTLTQNLTSFTGAGLLRGKDILPVMSGLFAKTRDLIPDREFIPALVDRLNTQTSKKLILDNIPRTPYQAQKVIEWATEKGTSLYVVRLRLTEDQVVDRGAYRLTCPCCSASYHPVLKPSAIANKCDSDGTELQKREGDKPELLRKSFRKHMAEADHIVAVLGNNAAIFNIPAASSVKDTEEQMLREINWALFY